MKELDDIYKHDLSHMMNNEGIDGVIKYMKKEIRFTQIIWMIITFTSIVLTMCFCSCSEVTPDEVIDDRLPSEYNYIPTFKP